MNRIIVSVWTRIENSVTLMCIFLSSFPRRKEAVKWAQFPDPKVAIRLAERTSFHWSKTWDRRGQQWLASGRRTGSGKNRRLEYIPGLDSSPPRASVFSV